MESTKWLIEAQPKAGASGWTTEHFDTFPPLMLRLHDLKPHLSAMHIRVRLPPLAEPNHRKQITELGFDTVS